MHHLLPSQVGESPPPLLPFAPPSSFSSTTSTTKHNHGHWWHVGGSFDVFNADETLFDTGIYLRDHIWFNPESVSRHDRRRCRGKLFISDWKDPVTDRSVIVGDRWLQRWISHRWPLRRRGQGIVIGGGVVVVNRQVWEGMEQRPRGFASDPNGGRAKRDRWLRQRNWVVVERVANGVYWICFINTLQEGDFGWHSNSIWAQPLV